MPLTLPRSSLVTSQFGNSGWLLGGTGRPHSWQVDRSGGAVCMSATYPVRERSCLKPPGRPVTWGSFDLIRGKHPGLHGGEGGNIGCETIP